MNGWGAILFNDAFTAHNAAQCLNKKYIGSRFVDLYLMTYADYRQFNAPKYGGMQSGPNSVNLSSFVNNDNKDRSLVMRGLPYRIDFNGIQKFFADVQLSDQGVFIEDLNGRRTGAALVIFQSEQVAQ